MKTRKEIRQMATENLDMAVVEVLLDMRKILFAMHPIKETKDETL